MVRFSALRALCRMLAPRNRTTVADRLRRGGALVAADVFIGSDVFFDEGFLPLLTIEPGAVIAAKSIIMLHDSAYNNVLGLPIKLGTVIIGQKAYIGANTTILCGVIIGAGAIVGAGSLVTQDIPDGMIAFGSPARVHGAVSEYAERYASSMAATQRFGYWDTPPWRERRLLSNREQIERGRDHIVARLSQRGQHEPD